MNDPEYFPDPFEFKPERWFQENVIKDPFTYTPFSSGVRNCIGQHLALIETRIILCELIKDYDLELEEGYKMRMVNRFMYEPFDPIKLKLTKKTE